MVSTHSKLENFIDGIGALRHLLIEANKKGSLIEGVVIYASLVDGLSRMSLVLYEQIKDKNSDINENYIYQDVKNKSYNHTLYTKTYSERAIFNKLAEEGLIDEDLKKDISDLYDVRNIAVHRFLLSDFAYSHLELVLERYELVYNKILNLVQDLEKKQIHLNVGMTEQDNSELDEEQIKNNALNKIYDTTKERLKNTLNISEDKKFFDFLDLDKIQDEVLEQKEIFKEKQKIPNGYSSIKEVVYFAKSNKFFDLCECGHEKIHHVNNNLSIEKCNTKECDCILFKNTESF